MTVKPSSVKGTALGHSALFFHFFLSFLLFIHKIMLFCQENFFVKAFIVLNKVAVDGNGYKYYHCVKLYKAVLSYLFVSDWKKMTAYS